MGNRLPRRHLVGLRTVRAGRLESDLRSLGFEWSQVEVRYFWHVGDAPDGSIISWACPGFYMRKDESEAWRLIGVDIVGARGIYRRVVNGAPKPPTFGEFLSAAADVVRVVGPFIPSPFPKR